MSSQVSPMFDSIDDWIIIAVVFAILFWGSAKIPQLAHSLGRAVGEFKKGKAESELELTQSQSNARVARDQAQLR